MKHIFFLCCFIAWMSIDAFSQAIHTTISYNKKDQPALMMELPYTEEVAADFVVQHMKKMGYTPETKGSLFGKSNKVNGYYIFKSVRMEGAEQPVDLYFKVEQKSSKQKDKSLVYLLTSPGGEQFINPQTASNSLKAVNGFFNNMPPAAVIYKRDRDIDDQQAAVNEAKKKMEKLKDEEASLTKKLEQLQNDLRKNKSSQEEQQNRINNEQQKLDGMKAKTTEG